MSVRWKQAPVPRGEQGEAAEEEDMAQVWQEAAPGFAWVCSILPLRDA